MKSILILILGSIIFNLAAYGDEQLVRCRTTLSLITKNASVDPASRFTQEELTVLFGVRDRMLAEKSSWTLLTSQAEVEMFSKVLGQKIVPGSKISMTEFEDLIIRSQRNYAHWFAAKRSKSFYRIVEKEDFFQAAQIGILLAIRGFKLEHKTVDGTVSSSFSELMKLYIRNETNKLIKDSAQLSMPASSLLSDMFIINAIASTLEFANRGKQPSLAAISAQYMKEYPDRKPISMKRIENLIARKRALDSVFSIFEKASSIETDDYEMFLPPSKDNPESTLETKHAAKYILQLFEQAHLDTIQKRILILRHGLPISIKEDSQFQYDEASASDGLTLREVAPLVSVSHERVRQLEMAATERMIKAIGEYKNRTLFNTLESEMGTKLAKTIELEPSEEGKRQKRLQKYKEKYGELLAP
ncbi:MAG: sigma-70 family RNA polymerase sigma factor [Oligoflexia bacterium]|nr:sigma-70 family RNA polymerase sigma factor [Oligoflexia bacterium]